MRLIKLLALPALFLCSCVEQEHEEQIDKLRRFYTFYITEASQHGRWEVDRDTLEKYCTKRFLQYSFADSSLDYDPVIWDDKCKKDWAKTVTVMKATEGREKQYRVNYLVDKNYTSHTFVVIMGKEDGAWKIDVVKE